MNLKIYCIFLTKYLRNMKKSLILLSILVICLTISCNKDDDNSGTSNEVTSEKLIGTWALRDRSEIGIDFCELSTTMKFGNERHFTLEKYIGDEPEDCRSAILEGNWFFLGNGKVKIKPLHQSADTLHLEFINQGRGLKLNKLDGSGYVETYAKQ